MQDSQTSRHTGRGTIIWGLLFIVAGLIWLLNNLGYLPGDFWRTLWRFWPVLVILLGVEVALRGFSNRVAIPLLLLAVVAIGAGVVVVAPSLPAEDLVADSFQQEMGRLNEAVVELEIDNGKLTIGGSSTPQGLLASGQFDHSSSVAIQKEYVEEGGRGTLRLFDRFEAFLSFFLGERRNDWALQLSADVPLDLKLTADDASVDLRLEELDLRTLTGELGDCTGEVRLPARDGLQVGLNVSGGGLTAVVPPTAGARVAVELDDSQLEIDSSRFVSTEEGVYLSQGYDQAESRLELTIQASDSTITIR
jgi:hypothetical protein